MDNDLIIYNADIYTGEDHFQGWLTVKGDRITAVERGEAQRHVIDQAREAVDAGGKMLLPGVIDAHVHFREPGMTHKGTTKTESEAALAGGVTSFIEMPNTNPATVSRRLWEEKMMKASTDSAVNYAYMVGATADNLAELQQLDYTQVPAVKVFMGSSTGSLFLHENKPLVSVFADQPGRIVVHAEDQDIINRNIAHFRENAKPELYNSMFFHTAIRSKKACISSTERALELAARYGKRLHVAHLSTKEETLMFDPGSDGFRQITCEVSPHHLINSTQNYAELGSRIKMNPSVKYPDDRYALCQGVRDGRIDIIATDHAPHLLSEKQGDIFTAASGAPMVQFSLVFMLDRFGPDIVAKRMSAVPANLFGIVDRGYLRPGAFADLVLVEELKEAHTVTDSEVKSLCGWTPMAGRYTFHRIDRVWVNGASRGGRALAFS